MKRNITINIFGQLYAIDEDAYELLNHYLNSMKRYFSDKEGGEEIADDIEHRVAELLWQQKEEGITAISIEVVKDIIGKIGNPTEIDSSTENVNTEEPPAADDKGESSETEARKTDNGLLGWLKGRYLYRNPKDKVLGGVCSGMAQFTGRGTSLIWRLGTIVAFFVFLGLGEYVHIGLAWLLIMLYIILWIIVPTPRTPEDRLRMRGQNVTPKTLNEEIISESDKAFTEETGNRNYGSGCLLLLLKFIVIICLLPLFLFIGMGMLVIIAIVVSLLGLSATMFPYLATGSMMWFPEYLTTHAGTIITGVIAIFAFITIPLYCIIRALRSNSKPMSAKLVTTCILLWILSIVVAIVSATSTLMTAHEAEHNNRLDTYIINNTDKDSTSQEPLPTGTSAVDTIGWQGEKQ